ncbi:hypothetical protein NEOLEDRAFT_539870 [Neolentinus lepideus HHB14362 ss-1]|uniref:Uncharacterized protein n=1 Tax=Neolentinus lepideus HHB14362 ss-1 TaxID=1314782 RepID=A0A165RBQ3_9AGAM|nr:hypothetical protein NEOLEDRAFT_539870 [Neolentinus lepideus HHB14362 ss-1]
MERPSHSHSTWNPDSSTAHRNLCARSLSQGSRKLYASDCAVLIPAAISAGRELTRRPAGRRGLGTDSISTPRQPSGTSPLPTRVQGQRARCHISASYWPPSYDHHDARSHGSAENTLDLKPTTRESA